MYIYVYIYVIYIIYIIYIICIYMCMYYMLVSTVQKGDF